MSGWERGTTPQRRHYAKLAGFLQLADERAVEMLLSGDELSDDSEEDVAAGQRPGSPPRTELQERVVEEILDQLKLQRDLKRQPSPKLTELLLELMEWAKQPGNDVSDDPGEIAD